MRLYFDAQGNMTESNLIFKISKIEHLEYLQNGKLYMNKLSSFRKYEKEGLGDKEEGMLANFSSGTVKIAGVDIEGVDNIKIHTFDKTPVFCVASVPMRKTSPDTYEYVISNELLEDFILEPNKDYGLLFIRKDMFVRQIKEKMKRLDMGWYWDAVEYTDNLPSFPKDERYKIIYRKRTRFSHQNEWRLTLFTEVEDHYELDIGSLASFSKFIPIRNKEQRITIGIKMN